MAWVEPIRLEHGLQASRGGGGSDHPRLVCIGGGTGLSTTLRGLKSVLSADGVELGRERLTAVVTVADDGGSTGRLRRAYPVLAPGDIRNCLVALADAESVLTQLFDFRFAGDGDVGGHSLGNLILTALAQIGGDFPAGVKLASSLLRVAGRVLPSTPDDVALLAQLADGSRVAGQHNIPRARGRIDRVSLVPSQARALPETIAAIAGADLVVLGPGSLYTSIIPVLLVREIGEAIARSRVPVVFVCNLMTEPGETDGFRASDMVRAVVRHVPGLKVHTVLANRAPLPAPAGGEDASGGAAPVVIDEAALRALGCDVVARDLIAVEPLARHDAVSLGRALVELVPVRRAVLETKA